jgi:arylsulfatase A-like enzyme
VTEPVSHLDVLPTVLQLLELPPHPAFQGRSLLESPEPSQRPAGVYLNIQGLKTAEAIVCWPWKLIARRGEKAASLFQLEQDPGELEDRRARDPEVATALETTLASQVFAQLEYHGRDDSERRARHAPRLLPCPNLPEVERAAAPLTDVRPSAPPGEGHPGGGKVPERKN